MQLIPLDGNQRNHWKEAAAAWNAACGPGLAITPSFVGYNCRPISGLTWEGRLAVEGGRTAGFVLAARLIGNPSVATEDSGWIEAVAVHPDYQRRGTGTALLDWAEGWLKKNGAQRIFLGGGLHPFAPSLPEDVNSLPFFEQRGWVWKNQDTWDVARDLGDGRPIVRGPMPQTQDRDGISTAVVEDRSALLEFLNRAFAGRWHFEAAEFLRQGGRVEDFVLLRLAGRVEGFAWLTFPNSARPLDRYYPHRLPKPWGQLGPIGVAEPVRGLGWGGLLLQSGLMALRARGVRGCIIDWTGLLDFYGKWGFKPYRRYLFVSKKLTD